MGLSARGSCRATSEKSSTPMGAAFVVAGGDTIFSELRFMAPGTDESTAAEVVVISARRLAGLSTTFLTGRRKNASPMTMTRRTASTARDLLVLSLLLAWTRVGSTLGLDSEIW